MPKKDFSEIICIIDRSGSMGSIRNDSIFGFNTFLQEQKKLPGEANLTLILFDDEYLVVHNNVNIQDVPELTEKTYVPRGWTALLDAIGKTIVTVGERLDKTPEENRPEKVIVAILTDGEENDSEEYTSKEKINEMITHQREKYNWQFIFLGANQDAFKTGGSLGINSADTFNFAANSVGTRSAYNNMTKTVSSYRTNS